MSDETVKRVMLRYHVHVADQRLRRREPIVDVVLDLLDAIERTV